MSQSKVFVYNPAQKTKEQLVAEFVIRQTEFEKLMAELKSAGKTTPPQHFLVAGQRGMGKTTLLLRIKYAIEDDPALSKFLIPIRFSEEQYGIGNLERLWEETARLLEDKNAAYANLYDEMLAHESKDDYESISFDMLEKKLKANKQRALLMIDNIGDLFKKFPEVEHHRLRKILMTSPQIQIIGGSASVLEYTFDYAQPFFEFFHQVKLQPLNEKAAHALLRTLAKGYGGVERIEDLIQNSPGRIDALRKLTGGVPRTMVLLFEIFVDEIDGNAFEDLQLLLDNVNSLYKHRMDELKAQQQQIIDALARAYTPITANEVLQQSKLYRSGLETNQVSSQLKQLSDNQLVEATESKGRTKTYSIRERFFNIWYLMRHGRKQNKEEVRWLIHFFEVWYTAKEWHELAKRQIDCMRSQRKYSAMAAYYKAQALHSLPLDEETKAELMQETQKFLLNNNSREWADIIKQQAQSGSQSGFLQKGIEAMRNGNNEIAEEMFLKAVKNKESDSEIFLGVLYHEALGNKEKAEEIFRNAPKPLSVVAMHALGYWYNNINEYDSAEKYYIKASDFGLEGAMYNLGILYSNFKLDYDKAEEYYIKAVKKGHVAAIYNLAIFYKEIRHDYDKAEKYYLMAVEKGDIDAIYNLANLYEDIRHDYDNAEKYYLKAIDKGHISAMYNLANLYDNVKYDYEKAEKYYLQAIENGHAGALNNVGLIYKNVKKDYEKAIGYFEKAIERGNTNAIVNLGLVHYTVKKDYDKAETLYLKATANGNVAAFYYLARLYEQVKKDYENAAVYYLKAAENGDKESYYFLASLYFNCIKDYDKAELYYNKALDSGDNAALTGLGELYEEIRKDYSKAEYYYLEAFKKGKQKEAAMDLVLLHDTAKKELTATINYAHELLVKEPDNLYVLWMLSIFGLTNSNYTEAFKYSETLLNMEAAYKDLEMVIDLLRYLLEKKQYHFILNQFKQPNGLLMLHAKPYYYVLAWFMRNDLPGEYEKTPAELKETVQEIIKQAEEDEKESNEEVSA